MTQNPGASPKGQCQLYTAVHMIRLKGPASEAHAHAAASQQRRRQRCKQFALDARQLLLLCSSAHPLTARGTSPAREHAAEGLVLAVGSGRHRSPRQRLPLKSRNEVQDAFDDWLCRQRHRKREIFQVSSDQALPRHWCCNPRHRPGPPSTPSPPGHFSLAAIAPAPRSGPLSRARAPRSSRRRVGP